MRYITLHYYPKYDIYAKVNYLVDGPFNVVYAQLLAHAQASPFLF